MNRISKKTIYNKFSFLITFLFFGIEDMLFEILNILLLIVKIIERRSCLKLNIQKTLTKES